MARLFTKKMEKSRELAITILDFFEDCLEEKDIVIPDDDRTGDVTEARLFGNTYYVLEERISALLRTYVK